MIMIKLYFCKVVFFSVALMLFHQDILATEYYVDGLKGIDSNSGTTIGYPWKTITKANNTLKAGDTLYIRSGTYNSQIKPVNSGTSTSSYITYQRYPEDPEWSVKITTSSYGAYLKEKSFIKFDGLYFFGTGSHWIMAEGTNYCVFQNCKFYNTNNAYSGILIRNGSSFNKIENCIFEDSPILSDINSCTFWDSECQNAFDANQPLPGKCDCLTAPSDMVRIASETGNISYGNIIDNNIFGKSEHESFSVTTINGEATNTVIRNNIINNTYHSGVSSYGRGLIQGNTFNGCGSEKEKNPVKDGRTIKNGAALYIMDNRAIIRFNTVINSDYGFYFGAKTYEESYKMRTYNNTFYNNLLQTLATGNGVRGYIENIFKNNIVFEDSNIRESNLVGSLAGYNSQFINFYDGLYLTKNYWKRNSFTPKKDTFYFKNQASTPRSLSYLSSNFSTEWHSDNFEANPNFKDAKNGDFNLTAQSNDMIDTGDWLTIITTPSGYGTSFIVSDSGYFYDGWGIPGETGDVIKTQNGNTTTIQAINYTTNSITVHPAIDFVKGEGLSLIYSGTKPDIGAYEFRDDYIYQINKVKNVMVIGAYQ
jgi:hypothetical protein